MTPCIEYQGARDPDGYGMEYYAPEQQVRRAHRLAWIRACGPIPEGMWVLHKCDNPPCINIEHLFLGTAQDNSDDMRAKRRERWAVGNMLPQSKLDATKVASIRMLLNSKRYTQYQIASMFGVNQSQISRVNTRETWAWVTANPT